MRRPTSNAGRGVLLDSLSEAEWQKQVLLWARQGGWCAIHIRRSLDPRTRFAAVQGVHQPSRGDDHDDQAGFPDLLLVRDGQPPIYVELKTNTGKLTMAQARWLDLLDAAGCFARVWQPRDFENVRRVLTGR